MSPPANPHAHVGRDFGGRFATSGLEISIRAPAWGATHPERLSGLRQVVSIHAPAWGATIAPERQAVSALVSIHAPAWGATPGLQQLYRFGAGFNPRARVGRDVFRQWRYWSALLFQSTCPRGARHEIAGRSLNKTVFQSTRPRGARLSMNRFQYLVLRFQSTRPRGARPPPRAS